MADLEGVPIDQFVMTAVAEKISALTAEAYLRTRTGRADPAALRTIPDKELHRAPLEGDE